MSNEEKPTFTQESWDKMQEEIAKSSETKEISELKARIEELEKENKVERENNVTANRVIDKLLSHKHEVEQKYEKLSEKWDKVIEEVEMEAEQSLDEDDPWEDEDPACNYCSKDNCLCEELENCRCGAYIYSEKAQKVIKCSDCIC